MKRLIGTTKIRSLNVKIASAEQMPVAQEQVSLLLRERHSIADPSEDDFSVRTQDEFIRMATATSPCQDRAPRRHRRRLAARRGLRHHEYHACLV
jgi:hypothetical protein